MHTNRLIHEKSPYLQQHAHNPVDWYPWSGEAFEKARAEDKPIFLSIGYSTCHWCHVMERESFENEQTAEILNRNFVPVKVDREERPDVDRIYMTYVQATTGGGGWPMSVWLTPDRKPFVGGTYFPPDSRYGRPGFAAVLEHIARVWKDDRQRVESSSDGVLAELQRITGSGPAVGGLSPDALEGCFLALRRSFDPRYGGFGSAPKFPRPSVCNFLLRHAARPRGGTEDGEREGVEMVLHTLRAMAAGGIHDQLAGGFHRYSVDERWFVPHFEKMLYDQAQLVTAYVEAWQISGDGLYAAVARRTLDYVLRDMTDSSGGFYSAEDADSVIDPAHPGVKGEGAFYIWTADEIAEAVGQSAARYFNYRYGVEGQGNVREDPHREFEARNILYQAFTPEETAAHFEKPPDEVADSLAESEGKLLALRSRRVRPHLDDKILTAWNGLMISAFARAGAALGEPRYLQTARRSADFLLGHLYDQGSGRLLRRYRDGDAAIPGFLDDYAFLAQGLLDLYEAGEGLDCFDSALRLTETMRQLFEDRENGGFYSTAEGDASLLMRLKEDYDGAEPAGNSIAVMNLLRLAEMTGQDALRRSADHALAALGERIMAAPVTAPQLLAAYQFSLARPKEIVIAGARPAELLGALHTRFVPHRVVILLDTEQARQRFAAWLPAVAGMGEIGGQTAAYVCENYTCRLPTADTREFIGLLQ